MRFITRVQTKSQLNPGLPIEIEAPSAKEAARKRFEYLSLAVQNMADIIEVDPLPQPATFRIKRTIEFDQIARS